MAYKRNPMRAERISSLARFVNSLESNANQTHSVQYFERTLDDSANRRLVIPEMFLATDAILLLMGNIARGLEVHPAVIGRRVAAENLYDCLNPGGYICLGHSEMMSRISPLFRVCRFSDATVYQKPGKDHDGN